METQVDLVELKNSPEIPFMQLSQFACSLQLCIEQAGRKDAVGQIMARCLLSVYDSKRYSFPINSLDLLSEDATIAILDILRLKRNGAKIHNLIKDGPAFFDLIVERLFPEKQDLPKYTVSLHPNITHRQLLILLNSIDCEMKRTDDDSYVVQPRPSHSNTNIHKFPHRKRQFGAATPVAPE